MNKDDKGYHRLLIWQRARDFVKLIYLHSENFPRSEEFGLKSQLRRAAVSVVLNIVEGYRRSSTKDFLHFLNIAEGSLAELEAALEISHDLDLLTDDIFVQTEVKRSEVGFLLHQFIKGLKKK
jgi:four helix bundle protein